MNIQRGEGYQVSIPSANLFVPEAKLHTIDTREVQHLMHGTSSGRGLLELGTAVLHYGTGHCKSVQVVNGDRIPLIPLHLAPADNGTPPRPIQNDRFEESVDRAAKEGKDMSSALETVEISGNLSVEEEDVVRGRLEEMEEAEEKEKANDRAIEDRIKVLVTCTGMAFW